MHFPAGGESSRLDLLPALFPHLAAVQVEKVTHDGNGLLISARAKNTEACCAGCGTLSSRIHSRYRRHLQDVTCGQAPVTIDLEVRRWFCVNPDCLVGTFVEQVTGLAPPYARRTPALQRLLEHIALALAGRAGARLAARLGLTASRSLLIRLIRALPDPEIGPITTVGVDEFAKRRGHSYATILIDMTTHRPIEVLDDRTAQVFAAWLREHPGIQVICRDRAGGFAEGASDGAPEAIQVADRWHLWANLCTAVESIVRAHRADLAESTPETSPAEIALVPGAPDVPESRTAIRTRERHATIQALLADGRTHTEICKILGLADKTVRKFRLAATADELINGPRKCPRPIDRYGPYLHRRWNEGVHDAAQLHAEITAQGYTGSKRSVRRFVEPLRPYQQVTDLPAPPPKVRDATRWLTSHPDHLTDDETAKLSQLKERSTALARLAEHVTAFAQMMTGRTGAQHLEDWLTNVETDDDLPTLRAFARGIRRDQDAVTNGLTLPHSSGAVEGNVTRVKALKRQMFGRANLDLLRKRILLA